MQEKDLFDDTQPMLRLRLKAKLISDTTRVFSGLAKNERALHRSFIKACRRSLEKDFKKGLKNIDKKVPIFIELPKLETCGNGMFKEVDPKTKEPVNNEVHVTPIEPTQQALKQSPNRFIEYSD